MVFAQKKRQEINQKVKESRRVRPVKNKLVDPIDDTPENVMRVLLNTKPKATDYCYCIKPEKKMIPVFVISLVDSKDRRQTLTSYMKDLDIPFEFVDAIDGRYGLAPKHEKEIDRKNANFGRGLSDAEFACALSHVKIYQRIVNEGIDYALVLEDDAIPTPDLKLYLAGGWYKGFDLTQLHTYPKTRVFSRNPIHLFENYFAYPRPPFRCSSACGYIISNYGSNHFLKNGLPITNHADFPLCVDDLARKKRARIVFPNLIIHPPRRSEQSIINHPAVFKNKRRFLGVDIPPFKRILYSYSKAPYRLLSKRLH